MSHVSSVDAYRLRLLRHIDECDWLHKVVWVTSFAVLTALLAQVRVYAPWNPYVPYTGQVLGVVLSGLVLGAGLGMASMLLYLAFGAVGLPVFADQSGGIEVILGATGGYMFGFVFASGVVGWLSRRWLDNPGRRHLARLGLVAILSLLLTFAVGTVILGLQGTFAFQGVGLTILISSAAITGISMLLLVWSKGESQAFLARLACGIIAVLLVYVPGVVVLGLITGMGLQDAVAYGALQFVPLDLAKVALSAGVAGGVLPAGRAGGA